MCLKIQDSDGALYASYIFQAYQYALDMGAHIVVNSFSNTYWSVPEDLPGAIYYKQNAAYEDAIRSLNASGVLVFAAAGNEQVRTASSFNACRKSRSCTATACMSPLRPAACNAQVSNDDLVSIGYPNLPCTVTADCIVAVGATDSNGDRWSEGSADPASKIKGSNYGAQTVDIGVIFVAQASITCQLCSILIRHSWARLPWQILYRCPWCKYTKRSSHICSQHRNREKVTYRPGQT